MNRLINIMILITLVGCSKDDPIKYGDVKTIMPSIHCVDKCVDRKLDITDEPFDGVAMKALIVLCRERYAIKHSCHKLVRVRVPPKAK